MTKEQFLVYLWGIYPVIKCYVIIVLVTAVLFGCVFSVIYLADGEEIMEKVKIFNKEHKVLSKNIKTLVIVSFLLSIFMPSRNTLIAIMVTPTVVDTIKNVKTSKTVDEVINLTTKKIIKEFKNE